MGKPVLKAAFFIFLSLSMTPIDAGRVHNAAVKLEGAAVSDNVASWPSLSSTTPEQRCEQWKEDFEQKTVEVRQRQEGLRSGGGALASAGLMMKLRTMIRIYENAARNECVWVQERDVDTENLQGMVDAGLTQNSCFPQAQALMAEEFESPQQQAWAMSLAIQMLVEERCTTEDIAEFEANMERRESGPAEAPAEIAQEVDALSESADQEVDAFVDALMDESGSSLLQTQDSAMFVHSLEQLVSLVAFLLIWAVLCLLFLPIILMVIGAVLCTLMYVLARFFGRGGVFGQHANLGSCMGWWIQQTQELTREGNELVMFGACVIAGVLGHPHMHHFGFYYPGYHIHHR